MMPIGALDSALTMDARGKVSVSTLANIPYSTFGAGAAEAPRTPPPVDPSGFAFLRPIGQLYEQPWTTARTWRLIAPGGSRSPVGYSKESCDYDLAVAATNRGQPGLLSSCFLAVCELARGKRLRELLIRGSSFAQPYQRQKRQVVQNGVAIGHSQLFTTSKAPPRNP